jgi:hypothetical protein
VKNIKSYKVFESDEFKQKQLRRLNKMETKILFDFITFMEIMRDEFPRDKESYLEFKKKIKPYEKYGYTKPLKYMIDRIEKALGHEDNYDKLKEEQDKFMSEHSKIIELIKSGNIDKALEINKDRINYVDDHIEMQKGVDYYVKDMRNPYYKKWSIFSRSGELISDFEKKHIDQLSEVKEKLNDKWTYLDFPKGKVHDFQYMLYFINELKDEGYSHRVKDIKNYLKFKYSDNKDFDKLIDIVENYLYNNNKKLIPEIMELVNKLEDVRKMNDKSKKNIKKVYRGLGFREEELEVKRSKLEDYILEQEKRNKYVATSKGEYSAKNFAYMKGHLSSDRISDIGYILEYEVSPDSILLDTEIFGSIFGESEVLIDVTKAKLKNIKEV